MAHGGVPPLEEHGLLGAGGWLRQVGARTSTSSTPSTSPTGRLWAPMIAPAPRPERPEGCRTLAVAGQLAEDVGEQGCQGCGFREATGTPG